MGVHHGFLHNLDELGALASPSGDNAIMGTGLGLGLGIEIGIALVCVTAT